MNTGGNSAIGYSVKMTIVKNGRRFVWGSFAKTPDDVGVGCVAFAVYPNTEKFGLSVASIDEGHVMSNKGSSGTGMVSVSNSPDFFASTRFIREYSFGSRADELALSVDLCEDWGGVTLTEVSTPFGQVGVGIKVAEVGGTVCSPNCVARELVEGDQVLVVCPVHSENN